MRLGGPKQRAALAVLASRPGEVVSTDGLTDALWGEKPPPTAATALQGHISRLRRLLGADIIATRAPGYVLECEPDDVDASRFERLVTESRSLPPAERSESLRNALSLWRGAALADVADLAVSLHELAGRLHDLRLDAHEELFDAEIALGRHVELVAELEAFVRSEPTRERAVAQLMLCLYRSGRQADALAAYRRFRLEINAMLALEPTQALRDLERQILLQDPALAPPTAPRPGHERRLPLTVAAVGLELPDGSELDAEAYAQATARARETVRLVFERHGATVERAGSAVVGLFGARAPNEDDAARALAAVRAALDAVGQVEDGQPMRSRAGVASGDAFGAESVAIEQALRLQAQADAGGVEVDGLTLTRARQREFRVDRKLAGRASERSRLRKLFDTAVRDRRSAVTVLGGPAGIGKSRLAEDLAASVAAGTRVLRSRCLSYGDGIGLLPAAELVRAAAGLPPDASAEHARTRLSQLVAGDDRSAPAVEQLLGVLGVAEETADTPAGWAVRRLLETLALRSPTLVIVEDLHWAAPAFLEVVERLAEPATAPLCVVATARDEPTGRLRSNTLKLAPLTSEACAEIVVELLGGSVEFSSLERLVDRADGNPLFLEELVHDQRASGRLRLNGVWRLDDPEETMPPSIQSLLAARVERLPDRERELLTRCSVLGRSFTLTSLGDLAEDVEEPLAWLLEAGLLQPATAEDDVEFRHVLIRDAAYASLPLGLKADLHERVAALLDREGSTREREALTVHHLDQAYRARSTLTQSGSGLPEAAARLAARAASLGHTLLTEGDVAAASSLLARAIELEPDSPLATIELGRARFDAGDLAAADEAFSLAADGELAERARVGRIDVLLHTDPDCNLEEAEDEIDELLVTLRRQRDDDGVVEALLARAYVSLTRGRVAEFAATLEEALVLTQTAGRSRAEAEILFLVCGATWYGPLPVADGIRRCEQVLGDAPDRPIVEAAALQALGVLRAMDGDYERARESVAASRSIRRDMGQDLGAAASAIDAGIVELLAGAYAAAELAFRSGYTELEQLGEKGYFSTLAGLLAAAVEAQGRQEEARELARAASGAAAAADVASQVGWRVTEARTLAETGKTTEAELVAGEAIAMADATDFLLLRGDAWAALADVAQARGDESAAADARETAVRVLEQKGLAPPAIAAWARVPES